MHFAEILIREIANQGLEGVTLDTLWQYLSSADAEFQLRIDAHSKRFLWKYMISMKCISFYVNPSPVILPGPFDRRDWLVDNDIGLFYEVPADYPICKLYPVNDTSTGSSCQFYRERVDVTEKIRQSSSTDLHVLEKVIEKWGNRLVVVASQEKRASILLGDKCTLKDISNNCYIMLEAIARNRYNGMPSTQNDGLTGIGLTASSIWYARQRLKQYNLIISQPYMSKRPPQPMSMGVLLHHWRYYRKFPFPNTVLIQKMLQMLRRSPKQAFPCTRIRAELGLSPVAFKRTYSFALRQGFITSQSMHISECVQFFLDRSEESLSVEERAQFIQDMHLGRPTAILVARVNDAQVSVKSWLAKFSKTKRPKRRRGGNLDDESDEDDDEDDDEDEESDEDEDNEEYDGQRATATGIQSSSLTNQGSQLVSTIEVNPSTVASLAPPSASEPLTTLPYSNETTGVWHTRNTGRQLTLKAYRKSLAACPNVNGEDSLPVQIARLLISHEMSAPMLLQILRIDHQLCRRFIRGFDVLRFVRVIKRSHEATFVLSRQFLTETERIEYMKNGISNKETQKEKRRAFILQYLDEHRVCQSITQIRHLLWEHEKAMGFQARMDHKSLHRILKEVIDSGKVVVHSVSTLQGEMRVLCHPDVSLDDPILTGVIESLDLSVLKKRMRSEQIRFSDGTLLQKNFKKLSDKAMHVIPCDMQVPPRMRKRLLLHQYLFYVLRELSADTKPVIEATKHVPPVYHDAYSWRRFVRPIRPPEGFSTGWFSLDDLVVSMPIGLYLHLVGTSWCPRILSRWLHLPPRLNKGETISKELIAEVDQQLSIGCNQDLPLAELLLFPLNCVQPPGGTIGRLASWLLSQTRIHAMASLCSELANYNLVSMFEDNVDGGNRTEGNETGMIKLIGYLHRNASLIDTRSAGPAYRVLTELKQCKLLHFKLESTVDIASYWQTMETICLNTRLGHRLLKDSLDNYCPRGTVIRAPIKVTNPAGFHVQDDGSLPSPSSWLIGSTDDPTVMALLNAPLKMGPEQAFQPCGAAGLPPSDFVHLNRNWERRIKKSVRKSTTSDEDSDPVGNDEMPSGSNSTQANSSVWTITSTDPVLVYPAEYFWQWSSRLFEDTDLPCGLENRQGIARTVKTPTGAFLAVRLGVNRMEKPSFPDRLQALREAARTTASLEKDTRSHIPVKHGPGAGNRRRPRHPKSPIDKSSHTSTGSTAVASDVDEFTNVRAPRCVWSSTEDQLLVVCRVASLLIVGPPMKDTMCMQYHVVRDLIHYYVPQTPPVKTTMACNRRLKLLLFIKRTEAVAAQVLLTRVASRPDLQLKFHHGRKRWALLCRDNPSEASAIFKDAVENIITEFLPKFSSLRVSLRDKSSTSKQTAETSISKLTSDQAMPVRIGGTRQTVEQQYLLMRMDADRESIGLEDAGKSRTAVVDYALGNYVLATFRWGTKYDRPFNEFYYNRVVRQYPRAQLNQTRISLISRGFVSRMKFVNTTDDFRSMNAQRIKLTSRFSFWATHEFALRIKYFVQARPFFTQLRQHILANSNATVPDEIPLSTHAFSTNSLGGTVAFYLEMFHLEELVTLQMQSRINDITFVGDERMQEVIDTYQSQREANKNSGAAAVRDASDVMPYQKRVTKGTVNRTVLRELQQAPICFADPQFWIDYGHNRRCRWFDHHLSFSGGKLHLLPRKQEVCSVVPPITQAVRWQNMLELPRSVEQVVRRDIENPVCIARMHERTTSKSANDEKSAKQTSNKMIDRAERFILNGRFSGRTVDQIKAELGDSREVSTVLDQLLDQNQIYRLGSTITRFVHRRHTRLWMVHLKTPTAATINLEGQLSTMDDVSQPITNEPPIKRPRCNSVLDDVEIPATSSANPITELTLRNELSKPINAVTQEPMAKQPRFESGVVETKVPTTKESDFQTSPSDEPSELWDDSLGFFFPECWLDECGARKPRLFCAFLQALLTQLTESAGTTLAKFAPQYQTLFGQQTVLKLAMWLHNLGAIRMVRVVSHGSASLFSGASTYEISTDLSMAAPDELTLIPTPQCVSIMVEFCDQYLRVHDQSTER